MVLLAVGDVVGAPGIDMLKKHLRAAKKMCGVDFTIVNGENASMTGINPRQAEDIFAAGADVITLGNHTWRQRSIKPYLDDCPNILRPANFLERLPGRGAGVFESPAGPVAVINFVGRCFMDHGPDNPFAMAKKLVADLKKEAKAVFVDMHAEASSERCAMGWYLDGEAAVVFGTHTHVQTADERVLPKGTGYISDLGMTGPLNSVLGIRPEQSIELFLGGLPGRYEAAPGPRQLCGAVFDIDMKSGLCTRAERVTIHD